MKKLSKQEYLEGAQNKLSSICSHYKVEDIDITNPKAPKIVVTDLRWEVTFIQALGTMVFNLKKDPNKVCWNAVRGKVVSVPGGDCKYRLDAQRRLAEAVPDTTLEVVSFDNTSKRAVIRDTVTSIEKELEFKQYLSRLKKGIASDFSTPSSGKLDVDFYSEEANVIRWCQKDLDEVCPGRFLVKSADVEIRSNKDVTRSRANVSLELTDLTHGYEIRVDRKSILQALIKDPEHRFPTNVVGVVTRFKAKLRELHLDSKYEILEHLDTSVDMYENSAKKQLETDYLFQFRDIERDMEFDSWWDTFRKFCLVPGYMFYGHNNISVEGKSISEVASSTGYSITTIYNMYKNHGEEFISKLPEGREAKTSIELLVSSWLEEEDVIYNKMHVSGYRPDFLLPDHNLIIECDGLYWHSDEFKKNNYHLKKKKAYDASGIRSLFFREDEILQKPEVVKSIITNALGNSTRVFARKTSHCTVSPSFFTENHLMGKGRGRIYSLSYEGEVVAAIRVSWKNKEEGLLEISRFCTKLGVSVTGGYSKLITEVIKNENPARILSYVDRRYGSGSYLVGLGWKLTSENKSFCWSDGKNTFHRMRYRGKTGYEQGLVRIWDCGQARWELEVK